MNDFSDRVVLITGAGSGIGRRFAQLFAEEGARIAAVDLSPELLESLASELEGDRAAYATADVTDSAAIAAAVEELQHQLGPADMLIACAGIGRETSAFNYCAEDVAAHIQVNLIGVSNSIAAVLPGMLARKHGHIVALSSLASYRGLPRLIAYSASKAGVNALMEGLRLELRGTGIHFTTMCPGYIRTPMTAPLENPPYLMELEYAVPRMMEAIRRKDLHCAFPAQTVWPLRFLNVLPARFGDWLANRSYRRTWEKTRIAAGSSAPLEQRVATPEKALPRG
jgi:NAD(P)-dependent dehydrogenase (short-subunit alcohol dehydrogenase family)